MEENVSYIVFESAQARLERTIKRLWVLCIILLLGLIISNGCWIYYESQWQYVQSSEEITQDGNGTNIISGGDTNYGATSEENN